jgi:hypothetical protein
MDDWLWVRSETEDPAFCCVHLLTLGQLRGDVAGGFVETPVERQLELDLPRSHVTIDGRRALTAQDVECVASMSMLLTQALFALPFRLLQGMASPLWVCQGQGMPTISVCGKQLYAQKDFRTFNVQGDGEVNYKHVIRIHVQVDNLYDRASVVSVENEDITEIDVK